MPRKQKKYHYIYKTTCQVTGKFYIGMHSTDNLEDGYLGSGKILGYSIGKHGRENHKKEILEFCETRDDLKKREAEVVNEELLTDPLCINLKYGGEGGFSRSATINGNKSPKRNKLEIQRKIDATNAATNKLRFGGNIGFHGFIPNWIGQKHSEETKQKMRKPKNQGATNSQFGTCWVTNGIPIKIKKEQLDEYLANGYRRGRKHVVIG